MSCVAPLACDQADDDCIAATAPDQTPTKLALFEACQDKATACPGFGAAVSKRSFWFPISWPWTFKRVSTKRAMR